MNFNLIIDTLLYAPFLFFFLGMLANVVKSDLVIPEPLPQLFTMYLLMAVGLNAGYEVFHNGISMDVVLLTGASLVFTSAVVLILFFILRNKFIPKDAAKIASATGTICVIAFMAALTFNGKVLKYHGGILVAILAFMESIVLILGIFFSKIVENKSIGYRKFTLKKTISNGSILLILGSIIIGYLIGEKGHKDFIPWEGIFQGMLAFFFLNSGMKITRHLKEVKRHLGKTISTY